jgi:hypothetical protein
MKSRRKILILIVLLAVLTLIVMASIFLLKPNQPHLKVYMIIQPENGLLTSVQQPTIPENDSYVIAKAEQACLSKDNNQVNITVIQTQNANQSYYFFETVKSSFLAQGFASYNLTSPYPTVELINSERPTIIILLKDNYVSICQSNSINLALEATNAQLNR